MARALPILPVMSNIVFLTILQLMQEQKIHGLSHLVNDRKKGSECEILSYPVLPLGLLSRWSNIGKVILRNPDCPPHSCAFLGGGCTRLNSILSYII